MSLFIALQGGGGRIKIRLFIELRKTRRTVRECCDLAGQVTVDGKFPGIQAASTSCYKSEAEANSLHQSCFWKHPYSERSKESMDFPRRLFVIAAAVEVVRESGQRDKPKSGFAR